MWTAGQVIGLIHDIPTCDELVNRIESEALEVLSHMRNLVVDEQPKPDIVGKAIGERKDPRDDGVSIAKSKL